MYRRIALTLVSLVVFALFPLTARASAPDINVNASPVVLDRLVPARAVAEAFGAQVSADFSGDLEYVTVKKDSMEIILTIDKDTALVNGVETKLNAPPRIINGGAAVPLGFISEAFGVTASWNDVTKTVEIISELPVNVTDTSTQSLLKGKFEWDKYYKKVLASDNPEDLEYGELIMFEGVIANIGQNNSNMGESGAEYILVNGAGSTWAVYIYNNRFNDLYIGDSITVYGITMGKDADLGHLSMNLLRDVVNEKVTNQRLAGFDLAYIYEGEKLKGPREIENFLNSRFQDYYASSAGFFTFKVNEVKENKITVIVGLNEEHPLGQVFRITNLTDKQSEDMYNVLKSRMTVLAMCLDIKCEGFTLSGYYYDSFKTDEGMYKMRYASWTNAEDSESSYYAEEKEGNIRWLSNDDYDWKFEPNRDYFKEEEDNE